MIFFCSTRRLQNHTTLSDIESDYEYPSVGAIKKPDRYKHRPRPKLMGKYGNVTYDSDDFRELLTYHQ